MSINVSSNQNLFSSNQSSKISNSQNIFKNIGGIKNFRSDSSSFSSKSKAMSSIEILMKNKEQIKENKNKLINDTLEKGGDLSSIKDRLNVFEEQMEAIDEEISSTMMKNVTEEEKDYKNLFNTKPKTQSEIFGNAFASLTSITCSLDQMKVLSSVQNKTEGQTRVLKSQVKTDEGVLRDNKLSKISDLESVSASISNMMTDKFNELTENLDENNNFDIVDKTNDDEETFVDEFELNDTTTDNGVVYQ